MKNILLLIFTVISMSSFAQETKKVYKYSDALRVDMNVEDSTYTLTFRDSRYNHIWEFEYLTIDPKEIYEQHQKVLETGEDYVSRRYRLRKKSIFVGDAFCRIPKNFFKKVYEKSTE